MRESSLARPALSPRLPAPAAESSASSGNESHMKKDSRLAISYGASGRTSPAFSPLAGSANWYEKSGDWRRPVKNHSTPVAKSFSVTPASKSV